MDSASTGQELARQRAERVAQRRGRSNINRENRLARRGQGTVRATARQFVEAI